MTGKGIEVAIERRHVDSAVHDPLTTVDEYRHALAVRRIDDRAQVGPRPEHVRRLRNAYDARAGIDQFVEPAGFERSGIVERKHSQLRPLALAEHLPRNDVRMVLHLGRNHVVALSDEMPAEAVRDQIDRGGRPRREDDLARRAGAYEPADGLACGLVLVGAGLAHVVQSPVHVGIHPAMQPVDLVDHRARLLGRRPAIEVRQRTAVDLAGKDRKVGPYFLYVESHHIRSILAAANSSIVPVSPSTGIFSIT